MIRKLFDWVSEHFIYGIIFYFATAMGLPKILESLGFRAAAYAARGFFQITDNVNWQPIYFLGFVISLNWLIAANLKTIKKYLSIGIKWDISGLDGVNYVATCTPYGKSFDSEADARIGSAQYLLELARAGKLHEFMKKENESLVKKITKKELKLGRFFPIKNLLVFDKEKEFAFGVFFNDENLKSICPRNIDNHNNYWRI